MKKTIKGEKTIWWCGCSISDDPLAKWEDKPLHEKNWNYRRLRIEYICHKARKVFVDEYKMEYGIERENENNNN